MGGPDLMATAMKLSLSVDALAALGAELRAQTEDIEVPTEIRRLLAAITRELGCDLDGLSTDDRRQVADGIRSCFIQAAELLEDPDRSPGWVYDDPVVLQSQGGTSISVARLICRIVPELDELDGRLSAGDGAFLDVGTGVAALTIEVARTFPTLRIVGIDPWRAALDLARGNVQAAGMGDRITLREQAVEDLTDVDAFDMVWIAGPFLPPAVTEPALGRGLAALRAGGWLVLGAYAGGAEPLAGLLAALRTLRGGGRVMDASESVELMSETGFTDVRPIERTWPAPVELVVGRRP